MARDLKPAYYERLIGRKGMFGHRIVMLSDVALKTIFVVRPNVPANNNSSTSRWNPSWALIDNPLPDVRMFLLAVFRRERRFP
jgi:hypothetical protein